MQGSQDIGVIIGQFWNGVDTRPENAKSGLDMDGNLYVGDWSSDDYSAGSTDDADNDRRFWKSRSGHVIGFDDTDGSETIQVWDSKGNLSLIFDSPNDRIILSNNVGDIHIRAKNDLFLEAGNNMKVKVAMDYDTEAGMSTSWKAGMDISSEADMNSEHKAGMNFDIKAGMGFKAKADMTAKIEGGMTFEAKGGMSGKLEGGMMATLKGAMVMIN